MDGMHEAFADLAACSGWSACADCGIWSDRSELVEYDGQLYHDHCLPVDMFAAGEQVRVKDSGDVGRVTGHGQFAVFVCLLDCRIVGFLPRELECVEVSND